MNCGWVRENVQLYLYDELADDARHEVEGHLSRCAACAAELASTRALHGVMSGLRQPEVTPNLLAAARLQLSGALEGAEQRRGWFWALDPMVLLRRASFSPALAAVIFLVGFGGGVGAMYHMSGGLHGAAPAAMQEASIAGVRNIVQA